VEGASAAGRSAILYLPTPPAAPSLFLSFALLLLPSEYKSFYTGIKESRRRWVYRKEKKKRERDALKIEKAISESENGLYSEKTEND
jgi:hypothetical protein